MHTQEVVCPACGKPAIVNVVKNQRTRTPCQHCKRKIEIHANRDGEITSIKMEGDCFIATACLNAVALDGSGLHELSILRQYRDKYVRNLNEGPAILTRYYEIAPRIVAAIQERPNSREIFHDIYINHLIEAVKVIELDQNEEALRAYSDLVTHLEREYLDPPL